MGCAPETPLGRSHEDGGDRGDSRSCEHESDLPGERWVGRECQGTSPWKACILAEKKEGRDERRDRVRGGRGTRRSEKAQECPGVVYRMTQDLQPSRQEAAAHIREPVMAKGGQRPSAVGWGRPGLEEMELSWEDFGHEWEEHTALA